MFFSLSLEAQDSYCGYKDACNCAKQNARVSYSFEYSDFIISGTVLVIDTLSLSEIVQKKSIDTLELGLMEYSECAKKAFKTGRVIRTKIALSESFKGEIKEKEIYVLTPVNADHCAYLDFEEGKHYTIFGTINETADIYYTWSLADDFYILKADYIYWTNKCKRTQQTSKKEIKKLKRLRKKAS